jgi:hypothetical protein
MKPLWIVGGLLTSIWLLAQPTWAVQYRLQVVNVDALTVLAEVENSGAVAHEVQHMSRLEARLDNGEFSAHLQSRDRLA